MVVRHCDALTLSNMTKTTCLTNQEETTLHLYTTFPPKKIHHDHHKYMLYASDILAIKEIPSLIKLVYRLLTARNQKNYF
jgi:hypothetical protein